MEVSLVTGESEMLLCNFGEYNTGKLMIFRNEKRNLFFLFVLRPDGSFANYVINSLVTQ